MRYLRLFESFSEIENILKRHGIKNYTINKDGLVNVDGNVDLSIRGLTNIPVKFGRVTGGFNCHDNNLTSLEGAPERVGGFFICSHNQLRTLLGAPQRVGSDFHCNDNKIISFEGAPKHVDGFYCTRNPIYEIWNLFGDYSGIDLLNDYDALQDGVIILDRLNAFLTHLGKEPVTSVKGWKCI